MHASALAAVPVFAELPPAARQAIAAGMAEEALEAGAKVVSEGDLGDRFYVIVSGAAEVTARGVPLASLQAGDTFGEIALLSPDCRRTATVTAVTDVRLLSLAAAQFHALLERYRDVREALERSARRLLAVRFLKLATPFASLDAPALLDLADHADSITVGAGETIIREGERGDRAFCIVAGRVEVLRGTEERRVAELEAGALFGEAGLLTGEARNATVRALEPTELLAVRRETVVAAMMSDGRVAAACLSLLRLRERPRRVPGIEAFDGSSADGARFTILKDRDRGRYFRLSPEGRFLWDRLDGDHDLRALAIEFFVTFKRFAPDLVAGIINALAAAGFVQVRGLAPDVQRLQAPGRWPMVLGAVRNALEWQVALDHCNGWMSRLFVAARLDWLYTRPAQVAMAAIILGGIAAFVLGANPAWHALQSSDEMPLLPWLVVPALGFAIVAHELGHAFTTKACGREVHRVGVGWHWITPVVFVDTTDMWLAGKRQRIAVSVGGLYVNVLLAGIAAILATVADRQLMPALWLFALLSYVAVVLNLNPLLEYDGYHVLSELLDRPNLRREALAWVGREVGTLGRGAASWRGHAVDLLYGLLSIAYLVAFGVAVLLPGRSWLQGRLASVMDESGAATLAWAVTALFAGATAIGLLADLASSWRRGRSLLPG